jgi:adenine-specific DNA methylase
MEDRRLIEEVLPIKEISIAAIKEKLVRHGHISTIHIWWARRPLVACRAAVLGSLLHDPSNEDERKKLVDFMVKFCTWEESTDKGLIEEARRVILQHNKGSSPKILDCFAGGGAIPLEVSRLGCEAHSLELNPVAVLVELCTLVYPQKYAKPFEAKSAQRNLGGEGKRRINNRLAYDVERWGIWVLEETEKEVGRFYPPDSDGSVPAAYLWARTVRCPNPRCRAEIPLVKQLWLANKPKRKIALKMISDEKNRNVRFEIVEGKAIDFNPKNGTIRLGSVECPVCRQGTYNKFAIKKVVRERGFGLQPLAVVTYNKTEGRRYRSFNEKDLKVFGEATATCNEISKKMSTGTISPIPNEPISTDYDWVLKPPMFGLTKWSDLFNPRQLLTLVTFCNKINLAYSNLVEECGDKEYARAVTAYLGLVLDRVADFTNNLCAWHPTWEFVAHLFARQAIPIAWDYAELVPFSPILTGTWNSMLHQVVEALNMFENFTTTPAVVRQGSATRLPYRDSTFDAIITDPPYYDQVPYSDLSDFFYVWLKRSVGKLMPDLFATPLAPKSEEIVEQSGKVTSAAKRVKDRKFYENGIARALAEVNRVLKPHGICVVVFAHKTTTAWETLIAAILNNGFSVSASWPLHTEMKTRLRAQQSAALASSVWLVCRKRSLEAGVGAWKNVQTELDNRVKERLDFFLSQGIRGADALLSAIGPALEVFGRYEKVEKVTGEAVTISEFLDKIREVVAHHALSTVLTEQELGKVDPLTAFYVLWKWTFEPSVQTAYTSTEGENEENARRIGNGPKTLVPFDDALKLARSVGAEIEALLRARLLKKEKEYVRMLGPIDRKDIHALGETGRDGTPPNIIDMVHRALILWAGQEHAKLEEYLEMSGAITNETFWRVAQALSNLLPLQSREKQLLDGLLGRHAAGVSETGRRHEDKTLDEFMMKDEVK